MRNYDILHFIVVLNFNHSCVTITVILFTYLFIGLFGYLFIIIISLP